MGRKNRLSKVETTQPSDGHVPMTSATTPPSPAAILSNHDEPIDGTVPPYASSHMPMPSIETSHCTTGASTLVASMSAKTSPLVL